MNSRVLTCLVVIALITVEINSHGGHGDDEGYKENTKKRKPLWNYYGKAKIDLEHVLEETKQVIKLQEENKISQKDAAFYFHRLHDFDKDGFLDGLELLHAVKHSLVHSNSSIDMSNLENLEKTVDSQLEYFDFNNDGLVEFSELMKYLTENTSEVKDESENED